MGKTIRDEDVRFNLIINGDSAQKELYDLEKQTRSLNQQNKALNAEKAKLVKQGKKNSQEYKNLTAEIKRNNTEVKQNKSRMDVLQKQLGNTSLTMRQLRSRSRDLKIALHNMVPGSAQYIKLQADLKAVETRISQLNMQSRVAQGSLSTLAQGFNKYAVLAGSFIAAGTGMVLSVQRMIDFNGKLSDAQADVMKTTGMTKDEVDELTKSFGLLKTRTARTELLELSAEAGRLGITGVKNVQDFVEVANQMKVALGDILSDEEIREVGKMVNIYKVGEATGKDFKDSMLALGSSLNEVGATGANTEKFLVNYLKRQAGVAVQARVSAQDNIGYAATFDEIGQSVEISATAMNKVWMDLFENTETYAKIAGMSLGDFTKLLNEDANEAMIRFLEGLNGNNEGLSIMVEKLADIEAGGARGAQALSAIAGQTNLLRQRQETANKALEEATSLTNEYELKNNNLAATLDKVRKQMLGWFTSEAIVNGMAGFMDWFAKFIGASEDADGSVTRFRNKLVFFVKILLILTAAWLSYNAALKLTVMWTNRAVILQKLLNAIQSRAIIITNTLRSAKLLLAAAYYTLTGNTVRATAAMRLFNATMLSNPLGVVLAILGAVVAALYLFGNNTERAATKQSMLNDSLKEANKQNAGTIAQLKILKQIAEDETKSQEARINAVKELNKIVPDYNKNLDLSEKALKKGKTALDSYIESLVKQAQAQYLLDQIKIKSEEIQKLQNASSEEHATWYDRLFSRIASIGSTVTHQSLVSSQGFKRQQQAIDDTTASLEAAKEAYKEFIAVNPNTMVTENEFVEDYTPSSSGGGSGSDTSSNRGEQLRREQDVLLKMQRDAEDARLSLIQDAFQREMAINDANHVRKVQDLEAKADEIVNAYNKAMEEGNTDVASALLYQYHVIYNQIEAEEALHQQRKNEILKNGIQADLDALQDKFNREQVQRETDQAMQLAALGANEEAKKKLQEQFDRENLEANKKHLEELIEMGQQILSSGEFEGFNLDLITEEQKQQIIARLQDVGLSVEQINALLAQMQGKDEGSLDLGLGGELDFFGFSAQQWVDTFTNLDTIEDKLAAASMAIEGLSNAWAMYNQYVTSAENRRLAQFERNQDNQRRALEQRLNSGYISQQQYDKAMDELQKEQDKRKAELEYTQAKRAWKMQLMQAVVNTALGVTQALSSSPPPASFILAALVGALGIAQIAILSKNKPVKGFETGFYNKSTIPIEREQDGKMFNAVYGGASRSGVVDKPTVYLAGEGGKNFPEMIIDGRTLKQFDPGLKQSLYRELARVRGFENGHYNPQAESASNVNNEMLMMVSGLMSKNIEVLDKIQRDGIAAFMDKDMRNIRLLRKEFKRLEDYENKSKVTQ